MVKLIIFHLIGDFLLQPADWADKKEKDFKKLLMHTLVYTFVMALAVLGEPNPVFFIFVGIIFITHLFIDNRKPVIWWLNHIKRDEEKPFWLIIVVDQIFHLIILYLLWVFLL